MVCVKGNLVNAQWLGRDGSSRGCRSNSWGGSFCDHQQSSNWFSLICILVLGRFSYQMVNMVVHGHHLYNLCTLEEANITLESWMTNMDDMIYVINPFKVEWDGSTLKCKVFGGSRTSSKKLYINSCKSWLGHMFRNNPTTC